MSVRAFLLVLAAAVVSLGILVIFSKFFYSQEPTLEKKISQQIAVEKPEETNEMVRPISLNVSFESFEGDPIDSRLLLAEDCPEMLDLSVATNQECMEAVELYFLGRATYTVNFAGMVPKDGPYTFRMTFDSVEIDRRLVVEALSRPNCQLLSGPIRLELHEMCNADAIFRYLHFHDMCQAAQHWKTKFEPNPSYRYTQTYYLDFLESTQRKADRHTEEETSVGVMQLSPEDWYVDERNEYRGNLLRDIWLQSTGKCSWMELSDDTTIQAYSADEDLLAPWFENLHIGIDKSKLRHVAARLGFEKELLRQSCGFHGKTTGSKYIGNDGCLGREYEKARREVYDSFIELRVGIESLYSFRPELLLKGLPRATALIRASLGLAGLEDAGFEADIDWITRFLCGECFECEKDCEMSIARAEKFLDPTNTKALRILDRISQRALELDPAPT